MKTNELLEWKRRLEAVRGLQTFRVNSLVTQIAAGPYEPPEPCVHHTRWEKETTETLERDRLVYGDPMKLGSVSR